MKIVCTEDMPCAREAFSTLGEVTVIPERTVTPEQIHSAEILAIRSTTKANAALLERSRVRFVGTATIGEDHLDKAWFADQQIHWCSAPGCNANSVSEYWVAALLTLGRRHGFSLRGKTVGIIGFGNVGRRIKQKAEILGMKILLNDPPKQRAGEPADFVSLKELLGKSDIVTLHVPLEKGGADPTYHLANSHFFDLLKPECIFINAARGAVTDSTALLRALDQRRVRHVILDTWEGEPVYREEVMQRTDLATPHIAGHSYEGKVIGTYMVYLSACQFLGLKPTWNPNAHLQEHMQNGPQPEISLDVNHLPDETALDRLVHQVYAIEEDDRRLRQTMGQSDEIRAKEFNRLRKNYPIRREYPFFKVKLHGASQRLTEIVQRLGFNLLA